MPALAFGLKPSKPSLTASKPAPKRRAAFGGDDLLSDEDASPAFQEATNKKQSRPLKPLNPLLDADEDNDDNPRPSKSPKLSSTSHANGTSQSNKFANLSALRSAKLHDQEVEKLDASVYDYDGNYDTFSSAKAAANKQSSSAQEGPRYMTTLLESSRQRERDRVRAQEKVLQRERENEGDEFADKEKFVTGAYKRQQEEMRKQEAEEEERLKAEEERKRQGVGMVDFNKKLLKKDEERMNALREAEERRKKEGGAVGEGAVEADPEDAEMREARELNENGGHIVVNDEGEVVDKRQLLSAGLNAAPKASTSSTANKPSSTVSRPGDTIRSSQAWSARDAQRERQSRMMERQLEQMTEQAEKAEVDQESQRAEKNKSKITEEAKMGARERYLARKREAEEAKKAKSGG